MNDNRIKVLFVATESGVAMASFAIAIINCLSQSSLFETKSILLSKSNGKGYEGKIKGGSNVYYLRSPKNKLKKILYKIWPIRIIGLIRNEKKNWKPDKIVFLTGECSLSLFVLLFPSKKYAYVVHDLYSHEVQIRGFRDWLLFLWIQWGYKIMRRSSYSLTTCSQFQLDCLKKMYRNKRICLTEFPSLINEVGMAGGESVPELKNIRDYILFFGGINVYKGVDLLIDAFLNSNLPEERKLVIAGRGTSLNYKQNSSIIRLNRFINDEELKDLFTKAALVVYPYRSITMSGVLSFPYYFGNRVLLSDVPFFRQNATKNTFYFKKGNVLDLSEKMVELLGEKEQRRCIYNNVYEDVFSFQRLVDSYYVFLRE